MTTLTGSPLAAVYFVIYAEIGVGPKVVGLKRTLPEQRHLAISFSHRHGRA
jgi:hypothetical protein